MSIITIKGFHACSSTGGKECVFLKAPFLSDASKEQWLTQGYYFWTDDDDLAHWWGYLRYKRNYLVVESKITIEEQCFLDLVGNQKQCKLFVEWAREYIKSANKKGIDFALEIGFSTENEIFVSLMIQVFRKIAKNSFFPFKAVKAADKSEETERFTNDAPERLVFIKRQQLCLFDDVNKKELIENITIHPPKKHNKNFTSTLRIKP